MSASGTENDDETINSNNFNGITNPEINLNGPRLVFPLSPHVSNPQIDTALQIHSHNRIIQNHTHSCPTLFPIGISLVVIHTLTNHRNLIGDSKSG